VADKGTVVEQAQVLTTHNLAVLFDVLGLREALGPDLEPMARRCYTWICRRLRFRPDETWHARLIAVKSCAYAWRQMVFYLSLLPPDAGGRPGMGRGRAGPAAAGAPGALPVRPFLGWTTGTHWLLA
jgi:hypothetical protein